MLVVLKIVHFFCLFGGGAAMIGNGLLASGIAASDRPPDALVSQAMRRLGMIGLASIALLWMTGAAMMVLKGGAPDALFYVKLAAAAAVLWGSVMAGVGANRAERDGVLPDFGRMKVISAVTWTGTALAVVLAVVVFG